METNQALLDSIGKTIMRIHQHPVTGDIIMSFTDGSSILIEAHGDDMTYIEATHNN